MSRETAGRQRAKPHQHSVFGGFQTDHLVRQKASEAVAVSHIVCSLLDLILQCLIRVAPPHVGQAALSSPGKYNRRRDQERGKKTSSWRSSFAPTL